MNRDNRYIDRRNGGMNREIETRMDKITYDLYKINNPKRLKYCPDGEILNPYTKRCKTQESAP